VNKKAGPLFTNFVKRGPAFFLLALALRLAFGLGYWTGEPLTRDEREYLSLARGVASGQGLVYDAALRADDPDPFGRAPGYPLFLAFIGGGGAPTSSVPTPVKVGQALVGAAGVLMVGLMAARLAGSAAGNAAALIAAIYPPLVFVSGYAYSEALAWPCGLAAAWLLDRGAGSDGTKATWAALGAGLAGGITALIRPATIVFLLLAGVWLLVRRQPRLAGVFLIGAVVTIAPWSMHVSRDNHRFVAIATEGGITFWTGNHPLAIGEGDFAANPAIKRDAQALRARHPGLNEAQMEPVYYREALSWMRAHPWQWIGLEVRKVWYLVVPMGPSYRLHSARFQIAAIASYGLLLPAAVIGCWRLGPRRRIAPGLWCLFASAVVAALIFFPQERFRVPVIDPLLIVCAGAAFARSSDTGALPAGARKAMTT
jgi:4-amino-4-deoxy-L-arabinose transferase-like glycosyltransferase